jgi:MFS transporter, putative metabolite transport protein
MVAARGERSERGVSISGAFSLEEHLRQAPLSRTQWLVWILAATGKFLEGVIVFIGGLLLPLLEQQFAIGPLQRAAVVAASLFGILVGSLAFGGLADRWGRRPVFSAEMVLLLLGLLLAGLSPDAGWLIAGLLIVGLALGADYPTAHLVIAESIPAPLRGRLVLGAFGFQALGVVSGTALAALLLGLAPASALPAWRLFYLLLILPVALLAAARLPLPESSHWLLSRGDLPAAERELARLLHRPDLRLLPLPQHDPERNPELNPDLPQRSMRWLAALRQLGSSPWRRATTLAAVPWFLQDLATYGIGIFLPLFLSGVLPGPVADGQTTHTLLLGELLRARTSLLIDLALVAGLAAAIALADRWGRIPLQILGFLGCAAGLLLAAVAAGGPSAPAQLPLLVGGLLLFQFMTNLGPNAQTYLLAGELFPTPLRGLGAGLAAAAGKVGAVVTALALPLLLSRWGSALVLLLLALTSLLGAAVTWWWRLEPMGRDLADEASARVPS